MPTVNVGDRFCSVILWFELRALLWIKSFDVF